jgi:VIT1/CCC1 family predicted Fe2+/Mn2+ transporter
MILSSRKQHRLAKQLILDELFGFTFYKALRKTAKPGLREILDELVPIEASHYRFWQDFFDTEIPKLDTGRRIKVTLLLFMGRTLGDRAVHVILEAIEVYGVRKYLHVYELYKDTPLGKAVHNILVDELKHEDKIVSKIAERQISPSRIRNIFLGFNDGLVEIVGAVSGFFAAFQSAGSVLVAGFTVAIAGSISMAAGVFAASSSEDEIKRTEIAKKHFLGNPTEGREEKERPLGSAVLVGVFYFLGAMVPIAPVVLGAKDIFISLASAAIMIVVMSFVLAFLSGMDIKKRIVINLIIITLAVAVTYGIGLIARDVWGVSI